MIIFKTIEYKNFLSTGNTPNKISLDTHKSTICTGFTGHGKSTLIDAITFILFNKPLRDLSRRDKLINSINGKNCEVTIDFSNNGKEYKVIRGLKPDKFEIYCNNELVPQEGNVRDYQAYLENQILHVNYKTFTQVVILGSTNYSPFMKLSPLDRRSVIEDILDIKVFSAMNDLLKKKITNTNKELSNISTEFAMTKNMAVAQQKVIETLKKSNNDIIATYTANMEQNNNTIDLLQLDLTTLSDNIAKLQQNITTHNATIKKLNDIKSDKLSSKLSLSALNKDIEFFTSNAVCPTCVQNITDQHKNNIIDTKTKDVYTHTNAIQEYDKLQQELESELNNNLTIINKIQEHNNEINNINSKMRYLQSQNKELLRNIEKLSRNDNIDLLKEEQKFKDLVVKGKELNVAKQRVMYEQSIHDIATLLLKDTGIKAKIITEYIPIINQFINEYINELELYVRFELDDQFKETIKSRGRDKFEYNSFSAGESQKLDLAILFTWRNIAKIKNSCNTNLLIMDEILDGHLDSNSTSCLLEIFKKYKDVNLFVISHSPENYIDSFERHLHIEKKNEFSVIK